MGFIDPHVPVATVSYREDQLRLRASLRGYSSRFIFRRNAL